MSMAVFGWGLKIASFGCILSTTFSDTIPLLAGEFRNWLVCGWKQPVDHSEPQWMSKASTQDYSLTLDIKILLKTVWVALRGKRRSE